MNIMQADYFLAAAEKLNFTAAARGLYISQPALSKQIAKLEDELETQLFIRNHKHIELTQAGLQLQQDLSKIRDLLDEAKKKAIQIGRETEQRIRIGYFSGLYVEDFLPQVAEYIGQTKDEYGSELRQGRMAQLHQWLESGQIDVAITLNADVESYFGCDYQVIVPRTEAIVFSERLFESKSERRKEDFREKKLLRMKAEHSPAIYQYFQRILEKYDMVPMKQSTYDDMQSLIMSVKQGIGYTILCQEAAEQYRGLCTVPLTQERGTDIVAVWKKKTPAVQRVIDLF